MTYFLRTDHVLAIFFCIAIVVSFGERAAAQQQPQPQPPKSGRPVRGILNQKAPSFGVIQWRHLPKGKTTIDIDDFKGKVLYLYGFQSWCPGCISHGFPTLQKLTKRFEGVDDVAFVAVQAVFEGFSTNTPDAAWRTAKRFGLSIPVGHDGSNGKRSVLMGRFRTGGTPWSVIIDKNGVVRFNDFFIEADDASKMINQLRAEKPKEITDRGGDEHAAPAATVQTLPASRGGQDVIGMKMPILQFDRWINDLRKLSKPKKNQVTLYRWWTDTCPYCESSLPAFEQLRKKYEKDGLAVVAVYHPKPVRRVASDVLVKRAEEFGYHGVVAEDRDWSELRKAYLDLRPREATSVSFLVDQKGVIRFLHPGPVLFESDDPKNAQENSDFELLDRAVGAVLAEGGEEEG